MPTTTPFYSHPDPHPIDAHNHPVLLASWPPPHWCPQPPRFTHILTPNIDAHNHPVLLPSWPPPSWCPQPPRFTRILTPTPLMPTTTPFYSHPDPLILRTIEPGLSWWLVECCFTSTETVGFLGTGAQDGHLDFHTAPELWLCWHRRGLNIAWSMTSLACYNQPVPSCFSFFFFLGGGGGGGRVVCLLVVCFVRSCCFCCSCCLITFS